MAGSKRIRENERQRMARQAARRAAARERARRRNAAIGAAVATLLVLGGVAFTAIKLARPDRSAAAAAAAAAAAKLGAPCVYARPAGATKPARDVGAPPLSAGNPKVPYTATMVTNRGTVQFDLRTADAPCTTNAFRYLAVKKYFDGTPCHRVTSGELSVLQCGDPTGTGSGGPGFTIKDENLKGATYPAGTVAMANSGPNTNGSQFFLVYKDSSLPPSYSPFGRITAGLDVLQKIAAAGSTPAGDGKPKQAVTIATLTVAQKAAG